MISAVEDEFANKILRTRLAESDRRPVGLPPK
jgi:hypothetical protein